jgi:type II secretory ATPase GspE/PulE/Tfp pilus assembly ATPase PilB-like protein
MNRFALESDSAPIVSDAIALIDRLLVAAVECGASDIHLEPTAGAFEVRLRIDGLLSSHATHDPTVGRSLVARLMVMAQLLTYRMDVPQEGRIHWHAPGAKSPMDLRLSIMPTTHGLRAAVRMPADLIQPKSLDQLGLPENVFQALLNFAKSDGGMLLVTGPAGSGKTTTIYALLQHLAETQPGQSIVALEDPVERDLPNVTQIEVSPFGQLTYERALRSILRQDPQVLMLGEIRDAETASLATQAALSGHRMICTLHAATPGGAIARLLEMGLEPYRITSAVNCVISQRLLRRVDPEHESDQSPKYRGRVPAAEVLTLSPALRSAILNRADAEQIQQLAATQPGYASLRDSAIDLAARGLTTLDEIARVLGPDASGKESA